MTDAIDVTRVLATQKFGALTVLVVAVSFFVIMSDGYDITALAFAAPFLVSAWHIGEPSALGPVFSASLFGMLFGAPFFGFIGDRFGRKVAIIISCFTFGLSTLAAAAASNLTELFYLRMIVGVGIGGLMPNLVALNDEYAPAGFRATLIIAMFTGVTVGAALPGAISLWLVPIYGWQVFFVVGGVFPLVMAIFVFLWLPESIKFLALRETTHRRAIALIARLMPEVSVHSKITSSAEKAARFSPAMLFSGPLKFITPLLWLCFACNLMGYYFLISWVPTILTTRTTLSPQDAATAGALIQIGGALGSWVLMRPVDRKGFVPIALFFAAAVPCVAAIGFAAVQGRALTLAVVFLAGFFVLGVQLGINAGSALIYPTSFRASGSGWAFGIGRAGSIFGPLVGSLLLAMKLPIGPLFLIAALPFAVGAVACSFLARSYSALTSR